MPDEIIKEDGQEKEVENPEGLGVPTLEPEGMVPQEVLDEQVEVQEEGTLTGKPVTDELDPEVVKRAKLQGWVPKSEFRGDEARWIPADQFVQRADEMMPILKGVNKKLEAQVTDLSEKLSDQSAMIDRMLKIQTKYTGDFYDSRIKDIKSRKEQAVRDGDTELFKTLEAEEATLEKPEVIEVEASDGTSTPATEIHPEVQRWMDENEAWYGIDPEMTSYASFIGEQMKRNQSPLALPGNEYKFCEAVKERVKATFPQKFSNPSQANAEIDESGLRGGDIEISNQKKTWNDLPQAAQQQGLRLIADMKDQGLEYTKERYVREYFEEGA
jgi:hypothetical protein